MTTRSVSDLCATARWRTLSGVAALLVSMGCTAPAVQQTHAPSSAALVTPSASATAATPAPTSSLTSEPAATPVPGAIPRDSLAVVAVEGLNLREGPGTDQPTQTVGPGIPTSGQPIRLSANERVWVIEAREVGAETWYHVVVELSFMSGWISGGPVTDPWLTPFDLATCPPSLDLGHPVFPLRSLVCFGPEQLSLAVYWPAPQETGVDVPCPWSEPRWLLCYEYVNVTGDGTRSLAVYGTTELDEFQRGVWLTLLGHYDDRRSQHCPDASGIPPDDTGRVAASVLFCRSRFVAEKVVAP